MTSKMRLEVRVRNLAQLNRAAAGAVVSASTRRVLHPGAPAAWSLPYEGVVETLRRRVPTACSSAEVLREAMDSVAIVPPRRPVPTRPVDAGGVPALWVGDPVPCGRVILYLHGGGYVSGSPRTHLSMLSELVAAASARVLALDFRLAPEYPFPAALVDAWTGYWWLIEQEVPPAHIVVAGDSAGGGLAAALLIALRDASLPLPAGAALLSPWLDLALQGHSLHTNAAHDYLNLPILRTAAEMYLGGADPWHPLASPVYADPSGLPPLLIQVGTSEMLLDDATRFARRATQAGVHVELELWETMIHVWHFLFPIEARSAHAIRSIGRFVRAVAPECASYGPKNLHPAS